MHAPDLTRILTSFADSPADIDLARGTVTFQVRDEILQAKIFSKEGSLWVDDGSGTEIAEGWLIRRIAKIPQLAERILSQVPTEPHFIHPTGRLLDQIEAVATDEPVEVTDALQSAAEVLSRRPGGTSTVLYLTSDAGEGKTTAINQLARQQADLYKRKQTDWLLVPISLAGRPFLRLDDIIISALVNRLRFPMMYYESFLEMVRMGVLVPALDGFEEMFIESASGEAVSALGSFVDAMASSGSLLVAARKAFFEYHSFSTQRRFFDALGTGSVSFARLDLLRWSRKNFVEYCTKRGVVDGARIYETMASRLGAKHPLLTRAVLVRRVVDVGTDTDRLETLLARVHESPEIYFQHFVHSIIEREAHEKWIDRSGEPAQPLLTVPQHYELLAMLAQEMWENKVDSLAGDLVDTIAEIFCEKNRIGLASARQIVERLKQHALIVRSHHATNIFSFDHDEFRYYFLGEAVGRVVSAGTVAELRRVLRPAALPGLTADIAVHWLRFTSHSLPEAVTKLQEAASVEGPISFTRENAGALVLRMLGVMAAEKPEIKALSFPPDALLERAIRGVTFVDCRFQPTGIIAASVQDVTFTRCEFERLDVDVDVLEGTSFIDCKIHSLIPRDADTGIYDPKAIQGYLGSIGAKGAAQGELPLRVTIEPRLDVTLKAFRFFRRATEVGENTIRARLGKRAHEFFDEVLDVLLRADVLRAVTHQGAGVQRRFRLVIRMNQIEAAEAACDGHFDDFLKRISA